MSIPDFSHPALLLMSYIPAVLTSLALSCSRSFIEIKPSSVFGSMTNKDISNDEKEEAFKKLV